MAITFFDTEVTLNDEQEQAYNLINAWLSGEHHYVCVNGTPGTGKTFVTTLTLGLAIKSIPDLSRKLLVVTPTHKAKKVVRDYLESQGLSFDVTTIHSALGIGLQIDEQEGKQTFRQSKIDGLPIENYEFVWCDEFSMVDDKLCNLLFSHARQILFTGDTRQLPPVNEENFPVWEMLHKLGGEIVQLTEPQRYSGDIKELVYGLIPYVDKRQLANPLEIAELGNEISYGRDWFSRWKDTDFENGNSIILSYANNTITAINDICREYIHGSRLPLQVGERVLAYSPINDVDGDAIANNGDELVIADKLPSKITVKVDGDIIQFDSVDYWFRGTKNVVRQIADGALEEWVAFLGDLRKKAIEKKITWGFYYHVQNLSANFKPPYALTIHKSQGSGYDDVFVINNFRYLKDGFQQPRLHYVAASRAKKRLHYSSAVR